MAFRPEAPRIAGMYDFLTAETGALPEQSDVSFVFGRKSKELVQAVIQAARLSRFLVISGNVGKDSGDLPFKHIAEGDYIADRVVEAGAIDRYRISIDYAAKNGLDNSRNGIAIMQNQLLLPEVGQLTTVVHATQARRLGATFLRQAEVADLGIGQLTHVASAYPFNENNPYDQAEAAAEVVRLYDFSDPNRADGPLFTRPEDLDPEMVAYAREVDAYYTALFASQGILNPSTADDTVRSHAILTAPLPR